MTAGAFMLKMFYPGVDGTLLYGDLAVAAVVVAIATRDRRGWPSPSQYARRSWRV